MGNVTRPTSLSAAIAALLEVAQTAGIAEDVARAEAESLAATIAEPATGAYVDWVRETGGGRTATDFMDAASRGRRFRSAPTPSMAQLTLIRSEHAPEYARALAGVAMAAVGLGQENARVLGNATTAAAAQLGEATGAPSPSVHDAAGPGSAPTLPGEGAAPVQPAPPDFPAAERLLTSVMNELKGVSSRIRGLRDEGITNVDVAARRRGAPYGSL